MNLQDALAGGGIVIVLLTLLEIAPIRINPWGALRSAGRKALGCFGSHINSGVLTELQAVRDAQEDMRRKLDSHIESDQRRSANECRASILHFNNELLRSIRHTKEEYIDILAEIDNYEAYCHSNPDYPNNRATMAIDNIKDNYRERLQHRDFLESFSGGE